MPYYYEWPDDDLFPGRAWEDRPKRGDDGYRPPSSIARDYMDRITERAQRDSDERRVIASSGLPQALAGRNKEIKELKKLISSLQAEKEAEAEAKLQVQTDQEAKEKLKILDLQAANEVHRKLALNKIKKKSKKTAKEASGARLKHLQDTTWACEDCHCRMLDSTQSKVDAVKKECASALAASFGSGIGCKMKKSPLAVTRCDQFTDWTDLV